MMCSNSSSKHSTIMKHLHREKCSHLHSCACACIRFHCVQCAVWRNEKNVRTHNATTQKTNSGYEKNECDVVTNVHEVHPVFYAFFSFPSFCKCDRIAMLNVWMRVVLCAGYLLCVSFPPFFYIHFPAVVFDKKTMYFVCLFVGCCFVCCFFLICFARCTRISLRFYSPLVNTHSLSIVCDSEYALHSCRDCNLTIAILVRLLPHFPSHSHSRLSVLHSHSRHSFHFSILFRWPISITVFDDI